MYTERYLFPAPSLDQQQVSALSVTLGKKNGVKPGARRLILLGISRADQTQGEAMAKTGYGCSFCGTDTPYVHERYCPRYETSTKARRAIKREQPEKPKDKS